jgi:hypothetical protein
MYCSMMRQTAVLLLAGATMNAAAFRFDTDPFAGSTALTTPGRQVVAGEAFISFSAAADVFSLDPAVFGISAPVIFANDIAANIPAAAEVVVLRTTDNDANPATPFGAGNAADLIAAQVTSPGPGLFIYFNSGLNLPRLVYSTDLSVNTADLRILARMTNLSGNSGALSAFSATNFDFTPVPEPSTAWLFTAATGFGALFWVMRRRGRQSGRSGQRCSSSTSIALIRG